MHEHKKLTPGERRFVVKARIVGRKTVYNVYDRIVGSYPRSRPDTGVVPENIEDQARAEEIALELENKRKVNDE